MDDRALLAELEPMAGKLYDPTRASQNPANVSRTRKLIQANTGYSGEADALKAYNGLRDHIPGMRTPAVNGP